MLGAPHRPSSPAAQAVGQPARSRGGAGAFFERAWQKTPRALLIGTVAVVVVLLVGALAFGPIVRRRVVAEAARRGVEVTIGTVRPGFFAVNLRDVDVRPLRVPAVRVHLEGVHVELSAGLSLRSIEARGGAIVVSGEPDEVLTQLQELRKGGDGEHTNAPNAARVPIRADDLTITWKLPSGEELSGAGLHAAREDDAIKIGGARGVLRYRHLSVEATSAELELGPGSVVRKLTADTVSVAYEPPRAAAPAASAAEADLTPPPLPPPVSPKKGKASGRAPVAPPPPASSEPIVPLPNLHALRAKIRGLAPLVTPRLPDGAVVDIAGLSAKVDVSGETVALGPGPFKLARKGDRVHLSFATLAAEEGKGSGSEPRPGTPAASTPLSIDADLPLDAGDATAHLAGGPVSLALLGVKEGTKGLTDVTRGTVEGKGQLVLTDAADTLTFDGRLALRSLAIKQPRLALEPIRGVDFSVSGRGVLTDAGMLRVDDAELDMGALHVKTHGTIEETPDHFAVSLALDVVPAACQALLDSTPEGLMPLVRPARMGGVFGATVRLGFDTRTIDKLALDYRIDDQCKMLEVPRDLSRDRFAGSFTYRTYHPDGKTTETTTGPGTSSWTDLDDISPFMVAAVLTTEDGAFYKHHGFNHSAIRSSVQANLKAGRFVRGASTITMQLAKNLFLSRDKALARKIEEVILTDYLEQIFQKDEMMELYLNVVEFGPDVYGITQAADYYFGRKPEELNVGECFFLATLLPSPVRYSKLRDKGEVSETWMRHLRALMEIAARNGKISRAELDEALKETVSFIRPGDPRPEPRKAVGPRRDPYEDDAGWQPLN